MGVEKLLSFVRLKLGSGSSGLSKFQVLDVGEDGSVSDKWLGGGGDLLQEYRLTVRGFGNQKVWRRLGGGAWGWNDDWSVVVE